ncbi:MAG: hypothetical protein JWP97_3825 [Labilithrix sp.]|nr:hypothetical protein [Labilithrix sp.]
MKRSLVLLALTVPATALFLGGCDGCNKTAPTGAGAENDAAPLPSASAPAAVHADAGSPLAAPPWLAVPGATAALLPNMGIPERFQIESSSRPKGLTVNVDSVLAALAKGGLTVVEKKQHLAQPFGARYCVGARVVKGTAETDPTQLQLSVCELVSPAVAEQSRVASLEAFKQIPNRDIHVKQQTTLTLRGESDAPDTVAAMKKAFAIYDAL